MNVLYIITGLSLGGAETVTVNLANMVKNRGHNVGIICLSGHVIINVPDDIAVYNLNLKKSPIAFIKSLVSAKKIITQFNPDVIHANMFHAIFFARILRLFVKIPKLICTEHSNNYHGKIRKVVERYTDYLSDLNTNVSNQATEFFINEGLFSKVKSITVYNGIDTKRFIKRNDSIIRNELCIKENSYVFINVSRFNEAKDHETLISAFSKVNKHNPDSYLICVGNGELLESRKKQVVDLGIEANVLFVGPKTNTEDYYNAADCFVLSSVWEGFGLVLVEAMACELEVISTDCGGTKEILSDKNYLVPIRDVDALAKKMIDVMNHSVEAKKQNGICNRKNILKFDLNIITDKWIELYQN